MSIHYTHNLHLGDCEKVLKGAWLIPYSFSCGVDMIGPDELLIHDHHVTLSQCIVIVVPLKIRGIELTFFRSERQVSATYHRTAPPPPRSQYFFFTQLQ